VRERSLHGGHLVVRNGLAYNRYYLRQVPRESLEEGEIGGANGACPLYRRAMLEDIAVDGEYFDETFFLYWEDVDLDWRAHLMGWRCWFTPRAVAHHVMEASGVATSARGRARIAVNRWLMFLKVIDLSLFLRHLPYILKLDWSRTRRILCDCPSSFLYLHKGLAATSCEVCARGAKSCRGVDGPRRRSSSGRNAAVSSSCAPRARDPAKCASRVATAAFSARTERIS